MSCVWPGCCSHAPAKADESSVSAAALAMVERKILVDLALNVGNGKLDQLATQAMNQCPPNIRDRVLAERYEQNWQKHKAHSELYSTTPNR